MPQSFEEVLALVDEKREGVLRTNLLNYIHLVAFERGRIEFRPAEGAPQGLAGQLGDFLNANTGARWIVSISQERGQLTIAEQRSQALVALEAEAEQHPLVKKVLDTFPDAEIKEVRPLDEE